MNRVISGHADFGLTLLGSHPLAHRKTVVWRSLDNEKLVSVSGASGNRLLTDSDIAKTSKRPSIQYEINHVTGAIIPSLSLDTLLHPGIEGIPLIDPATSLTLGLILRKGDKPHGVAQSLADTLLTAIRDI